MAESSQQKLSRNRPPRVQITYDVEIGNAIEKKEIPFVMGVMANLSGFGAGRPVSDDDQPEKLKDRSFVEIDRDNFAGVMARINPRVSVTVADAQDILARSEGRDPAEITYALELKSLEDFSPASLVGKLTTASSVGPKTNIQSLWEERKWLRDMLTKLDGNDDLEAAWSEATSPDKLTEFQQATAALLEGPKTEE